MEWFDDWRAMRYICNSSYRMTLGELPAGLESYWRHSAPDEYKGIQTDAFFFARAAEGLMKFFYIVTLSGKPCALPSEAADSIWHAWLRWDPAGLERFCIEHFGKAIPHVERAGLEAGALLNSFVCCRRYEGVAFHALRLPALFRLDVRLKMRGGHGYWNRIGSGQIVYARLDVRGLGRRQASPHPELTQGALQATGLRYPCSVGITSSGDTTSFAFVGGDADGSSCGGGCGGGGD